jgi:Cu/Ag efflux protein CusF
LESWRDTDPGAYSTRIEAKGREDVVMRKLCVAAAAFASVALAPGGADAQETAAKGVFHGHGIVKAVEPGTGALTLSHDEIKGFMPAMEMMYRVRAPEVIMSGSLKPGDAIDFTIDAAKYTILGVKVVGRAK